MRTPFTSLVVVNYLHLFGSAFRPRETHSVLLVDSYAVLAFSVSSELFQPVARRDPQVVQLRGLVDLVELSAGYTPEIPRARLPSLLRVPPVKDIFGALVFERNDHAPTV